MPTHQPDSPVTAEAILLLFCEVASSGDMPDQGVTAHLSPAAEDVAKLDGAKLYVFDACQGLMVELSRQRLSP